MVTKNIFVEYLIGAFLLFKMDALKEVGYFEENIFLFYEEKDLEDIVQRVLGNQDEAKRLQEQLMSQKLLNFYKGNITFKVKEVNYEEFVKEVYK